MTLRYFRIFYRILEFFKEPLLVFNTLQYSEGLTFRKGFKIDKNKMWGNFPKNLIPHFFYVFLKNLNTILKLYLEDFRVFFSFKLSILWMPTCQLIFIECLLYPLSIKI